MTMRSLKITALAGLFALSNPVFAANIAVFGDNSIEDFLNSNGHTATIVSDANLATDGFLDTYDIFVYTRNGSSFGTSLSAAAASNVAAFVEGNVTLFTSDLADNGFGDTNKATLMLNAVNWSGQKGYIGEFTGSCAAMSSNNQSLEPLGLLEGECNQLSSGLGGDPMDIILNDHPVVAGIPDPVNLGGAHEFFALVAADQQLIVAVNSATNPSIVAGAGTVSGGDDVRATFAVSKSFSDNSTGEVEVSLVCNGGLPLTQSFTISPDLGVTFTLRDFNEGSVNCTVTETIGAEGYSPSYDNGTVVSTTECAYTGVTSGAYSCDITNSLETFSFEVEYEMDDTTTDVDGNTVSYNLVCGPLFDGYTYTQAGSFAIQGDDGLSDEFDFGQPVYEPNDDDDDLRTVCVVQDIVPSVSTVDVAGCEAQSFEFGETEGGCTLTASVFFEGIPTLSQYGLAIMALLMLGIGFVGFRRFV